MTRTLKRRTNQSSPNTPDSSKKDTKKRKALVLSDSSTEDIRAHVSSETEVSVPAGPSGVDPLEEQLLNDDGGNISANNHAVNEEDELDERSDGEVNADGADPQSDGVMEVDNVDMSNLPFHDC